MNALAHFEAFCSLNGPQFYGLPVNTGWVELVRDEQQVPENIALADDSLVPFLAGETVRWSVKNKNALTCCYILDLTVYISSILNRGPLCVLKSL